MNLLDTSWRRRLPMTLQGEAAECGLACLAMVAGYYGYETDLASLRSRHAVSLQGARLDDLMRTAANMQISSRALRAEVEALGDLSLPAILHVDFNHFVVLAAVRANRYEVHDPALGRQAWNTEELSRRFTGVVLETAPDAGFRPRKERRLVSFAVLIGHIRGLVTGVGQALGLALALEVFVLAAPFYLQWVVDDVVISADRDLLTVLALGFGLLVSFQVLVTALRSWVLAVVGIHLNLAMMRRLFAHLLRLPMRFFAARHLGDLTTRFESLDTIQRTLTGSALAAVMDGLMGIATLVMMYIFSPLLCAVVALAALAYAALRFALFKPLRAASEDQIVRGGKRYSHFLETLRGMQSIKLFGAQVLRNSGYQNLLVAEFNAGLRVQRLEIIYKALNGFVFGAENILVIAFAAHLIMTGAFTAGMLLAFMAFKQQFIGRVASLIDTLIALRMMGLHRERVSDIALTEPDRSETESALGQPARYEITIDDVRFRYADNTPDVVHGASMRVAAGESVALVGPSGCGKTTLLKMVLGLLEPDGGEIRIGGMPIAQIDTAWRRDNIAAVMQEDHLLAGSLYDNIAFFDPQIDQSRVEQCARSACIHEDIVHLPMGYHTLVGDMGSVLSGGQKQRMLLARALYRQPRILVLDEATSHLDVACERTVNAEIARLSITRLIVAHRPETIASADRIIDLADIEHFRNCSQVEAPRTTPRQQSSIGLSQAVANRTAVAHVSA